MKNTKEIDSKLQELLEKISQKSQVIHTIKTKCQDLENDKKQKLMDLNKLKETKKEKEKEKEKELNTQIDTMDTEIHNKKTKLKVKE